MTILQTAFSPSPAETSVSETVSSYPYVVGNDTRLHELINMLGTTKLGAELLKDAEKAGIQIQTDVLRGSHGCYCSEQNAVRLNAGDSFDRQVVTLAHELRHAQQYKRGLQLDAFLDQPKDYLHSQWMIEADANVVSCLVAWDLNQQGNGKPMQAYAEENGHIFTPFAAEAEKGGIQSGSAQRAAFYGWFTDMYIRSAYEKNYLRNFEFKNRRATSQERKNALQRPVSLTDNIAKVCLVDNKQYLSAQEASAFFAKPEMNSVQHETYWAIFRHLRDVKGYDFLAKPEDVMKKEGNLTIRESYCYDIQRPSLEQRQTQAAAKIAAHKEKHSVSALTAALVAKQKNMLEK